MTSINQRLFKPKTCAVVAMLKYLCMQSAMSGNIQFGFYLSLDNASNIFLFIGVLPENWKLLGPVDVWPGFFFDQPVIPGI